MRFLILSDMFSLESWLVEGQEPEIMPAVYSFFNYLGSHPSHQFHALIPFYGKSKKISFPNGSVIELVNIRMPAYYLRKFVSLFRLYAIAKSKLRAEKFDVVYGLAVYSITANLLGKKLGVLSVSRIFGSLLYNALKKKQYSKIFTRYILQYFEARSNADLIVCTEDGTQFEKAVQILNPKQDVHLMINGMSDSLREKLLKIPVIIPNSDQKVNLISVGRLTHWKRHDLAIELLFQLRNEFNWKHASLTILGKGSQKRKLIELVNHLNLTDWVHFLDPIPHENIASILEKHHIFLSLYDVSNLSNSMWEASLAGKIICTRPTGKTGEIFKSGVNCIMHQNIENIAQLINQLDEKEYLKMANQVRKDINKMIPSWKDRFEAELNLIHESRFQ